MKRFCHSSPAHPLLHCWFLALLILLTGCGRLHGTTLGANAPNPHSVTLSWKASVSPVTGYNVYRTPKPGAPGLRIARNFRGTQYTDKTVEAGHTYSYYVTAVDAKGKESSPSERVTVTVPNN